MIELKHVTCAYGEKTPIRDLTLALPDAGVIAVFGASGGTGGAQVLPLSCRSVKMHAPFSL